ncbi:MAG: hypothetical protein CL845_09775 [Crocinitomicaceae bacterium]|nr:hypothetical protein [Crocinitomicaceae bacterium]
MKEYLENLLGRLQSYYQKTQIVWLWTNTTVWTLASFWSDNFWEDSYDSGRGNLWPIQDGISFFERDFSVEEWLLFAVGPWIVVYFLNKAKDY